MALLLISPELLRETISSGLPEIRAAADHIAALEGGGWTVIDDLEAVTAASPQLPTLRACREAALPLLVVATSGSIRSTAGFELHLVPTKEWVVERSPVDLEDRYFDADLVAAQRLTQGDIAGANGLADQWEVQLVIDLTLLLKADREGLALRVLRNTSPLEHLLLETPWWELASFVQVGPRQVFLVLVAGRDWFVTTRFAAFTPLSLDEDVTLPKPLTELADLRRATGHMDSIACVPDELVPIGPTDHTVFLGICERLGAAAAACAWYWMATTSTVGSRNMALEFFGQRRITVVLAGDGVPGLPGAAALDLFAWAAADRSPDRVTALRQVAAFKDPDTLIGAAGELRRAAEPVYLALRSTTIAEVIRSQRETRLAVVAAGRQASDAVVAAAKSVAERTIAALVAIGGLVLTKASTSTPNLLIKRLTFGVVCAALALALWNLLVEGPAITVPIRAIRADILLLGDVLSENEREETLRMEAIRLARRQAFRIRLVAPLVYAAVAGLALVFAYPQPQWFWRATDRVGRAVSWNVLLGTLLLAGTSTALLWRRHQRSSGN